MATDVVVSGTFPPPGWDSDEGKFYEVVDGQIVENPPMGAQESILASFLQGLMDPIARTNRLGRAATETLFLIDRTGKLKRRPDLAFVSDQRWPLRRRVPGTEAWDVIPDLTVEFVSETNTANSIVVKIEEYFQAGVRAVWVIYPVVSKVYVYDSPTRARILQLGDELDGGNMIPGFRVALSTLFEEGSEQPEPEQPIEGQPETNH
jgi:Uma2 family endonuclease